MVKLNWSDLLRALFPFHVPERHGWFTLPEIERVLRQTSQTDGHVFFPTGGGHDLRDCSVDEATGRVILGFGPWLHPQPVTPTSLTCDTFGENYSLAYFRLESKEGPHVIFSKESTFAANEATYDARHARMTQDEFRAYRQIIANQYYR